MPKIDFNELASNLENNKQVEFIYDNIFNAISLDKGDWYFISNYESIKLAPANEKKWLITFLKGMKVNDKTVEEIFNLGLYDENSLYIH